jgi:hypothetical protein
MVGSQCFAEVMNKVITMQGEERRGGEKEKRWIEVVRRQLRRWWRRGRKRALRHCGSWASSVAKDDK